MLIALVIGIAPAMAKADTGSPAAQQAAQQAANEPSQMVTRAAGRFRIFNAMLYRGMPDVGERLPVVYESTFFPGGSTGTDGRVSDEGINKALDAVRLQRASPWFANASLVAIDIERWPVWPFATGSHHETAIERYADVAARFGRALGEPICLYGIAPEIGPNHAVRLAAEPLLHQQFESASAVTRRELLPHVAALCPPLYSFYDSDDPTVARLHLDHWRVFARETIAQGRRMAPDKPVYPFVWPQFHQGGSFTDFRFVPSPIWREQLLAIREQADGLILWGGWNMSTNEQLDWNPDAAWWRIFRDVFPDQ